MTSSSISKRAVVDRLEWVARMIHDIRSLPLSDRAEFFADSRNLWAAESCSRRGLEALLDLGRYILAKGFGVGVSEYKEIAVQLEQHGVISSAEMELLNLLAGYRNRLVHFYHKVSPEELYTICTDRLVDLERIAQAYTSWLKANPERLDEGL